MATWTAPSSISGSVWDGPSGCPIVSPSNWENQVLANLCVLAAHDHSGSAGEGNITFASSAFPAIDSDFFSPFFPTASTNWATTINSNFPMYGRMSTSVNGATVSYSVYLRDGTYNLEFYSGYGSAMGILVACLSNVCIPGASWDLYQPGGESPTSIGACVGISFSVSGYGERGLTFAVNGSNNSSTGYIARIGPISMRRIGS